MTWVPWFVSASLIVNAFAIIRMSLWLKECRQRNEALHVELESYRKFVEVLLIRTAGHIRCDVCKKVIGPNQNASIHVGPSLAMIGHAVCLPPLPENDS